jgi:hypothetical protein
MPGGSIFPPKDFGPAINRAAVEVTSIVGPARKSESFVSLAHAREIFLQLQSWAA